MAKSNKDVDRRSTKKYKPKPHQKLGASPLTFKHHDEEEWEENKKKAQAKPMRPNWATNGAPKPYIPTYTHLDSFDDSDFEDVNGKNPCGWGSFSHSLRSMTGRK